MMKEDGASFGTNGVELSDVLRFEVSAEDAGERLDAYLAARIADVSRTNLKRLIEDADVLVDEKARKPSYKLRAGETIEVEITASPPPLNLAAENIPLDIVYEDDDLIIVNKPAGLVIHPGAGVPTGTLANALVYHFEGLAERAGAMRPGLVHRLDKETSGLIVVAKNESAHENLGDQFRSREVFKSYVALVHGRIDAEKGVVDQPIARDPRHRTRMAVVRGGRAALTHYCVRQRFERFTLLDVEIKTGRTHQIRVHLAWLKHPVVGDDLYGMGRDRNLPDAKLRGMIAALGRQFLHAAQLGFRHPRTGEIKRFIAPLPAELTEFLSKLEQ